MHRRLRRLQQKIHKLPHPVRTLIGILLLLGGFLWFLPILGLWMIPLGLLVLSLDFRWARRGYLTTMVWLRKWRHRKRK